MTKRFFSSAIAAALLFAGIAGCAPKATDALAEKSLPAPYAELSDGLLGGISPQGWTLEFLKRQGSGLTGHPDAMSYPYNSCLWAGLMKRNTDTYGCEWWRYEQTGYYTDGLLKLGYLLNDEDFIRTAVEGIEYTFANADSLGRLGTYIDKPVDTMWPICVYFRVLQAYYEKTGDERVVEMLHRHYLTYTPEQLEVWRSIISIEGMLWVYGKTGDEKLLELCETAWNAGKHGDLTPEVCLSDEKMLMHGVTCCEELKLPLLLYAYTGKSGYLEQALNAQRKLERDDLLPDGVIASAEELVGNDNVINSHETCDIADYTWALGYFLMVTGEGKWADKIEQAVFNALPGAVTKDFKSLQYFSSVNQFLATGDSNHNDFFHGSTWMAYRPTHQTECCAGNVHRVMPNYLSRMWLRRGEDGIAAALYGPSVFEFTSGSGARCSILEQTRYPFEGDITFRFSLEGGSAKIPFSFRIPEWSTGVDVELNGKKLSGTFRKGEFATVERVFRDGDSLKISFAMEPECVSFKNQGVYFRRGPLLFSYAIPQIKQADTRVYANMYGKVPEEAGFDCWSFTPSGDWNYAWAGSGCEDIRVVLSEDDGAYPFDPGCASVRLEIPAMKIDWELEEGRYTPRMPDPRDVKAVGEEVYTLTLVPYGCTELRLTVFPELKDSL